jgi:hypothetical protein
MISCEEYQLLDDLLQAQLLKLDGVYLMLRKTANVKVELFALYGFYVEVFYKKSDNEPLYFKSFEGGRNLDVYLEAITIHGIFEKL